MSWLQIQTITSTVLDLYDVRFCGYVSTTAIHEYVFPWWLINFITNNEEYFQTKADVQC
jgi:hypothetical protein